MQSNGPEFPRHDGKAVSSVGSDDFRTRVDIAKDDRARADDGVLSDRDAGADRGAGADENTVRTPDLPRQDGARCNVDEVAQYAVMIDADARIDDTVSAHPGRGVDDCARVDEGTGPDFHEVRDGGGCVSYLRKGGTRIDAALCDTAMHMRQAKADRYLYRVQEPVVRQHVVGPKNRRTEKTRSRRIGIKEPAHGTARTATGIEQYFCVAARAQNNDIFQVRTPVIYAKIIGTPWVSTRLP